MLATYITNLVIPTNLEASETEGAQDKKLTDGEIKGLKDAGINSEELKGGKSTGKTDLYKNKNGDIIIKPKGGKGPGEPTGYNIKDFLRLDSTEDKWQQKRK